MNLEMRKESRPPEATEALQAANSFEELFDQLANSPGLTSETSGKKYPTYEVARQLMFFLEEFQRIRREGGRGIEVCKQLETNPDSIFNPLGVIHHSRFRKVIVDTWVNIINRSMESSANIGVGALINISTCLAKYNEIRAKFGLEPIISQAEARAQETQRSTSESIRNITN